MALSPEHAAGLRRYLEIGGTVGIKSCDGPALERAALYAHHAKPCTRCFGDVAGDIPGTGFVWSGGRSGLARRDVAMRAAREANESMGLADPTDRDVIGDQVCPECRGMGWVVDLRKRHDRPAELTARPTGSSQRPWSGAAEPAEVGTMLLLGIVSSRLRAVGSPHAEVLCAYYLPSLQRETTHAVWPLTDAGRELLAPYGQDLSPWQAVTEALVAQVTKPSDVRRALIERADRQAVSALRAAFDAWAAVTGGAVDALARVAS